MFRFTTARKLEREQKQQQQTRSSQFPRGQKSKNAQNPSVIDKDECLLIIIIFKLSLKDILTERFLWPTYPRLRIPCQAPPIQFHLRMSKTVYNRSLISQHTQGAVCLQERRMLSEDAILKIKRKKNSLKCMYEKKNDD